MDYSTLYSFTGSPNGSNPYSNVIYVNGILYGTTSLGGTNDSGSLFSFDILSSVLTVLHSFTGGVSDGLYPRSSVIYLNGILYGTTIAGAGGFGTLYSYDITLNSFNILHSFAVADGVSPQAYVIYQNGILYGTTLAGGTNGFGTLFSFNLSSIVFTNLFSFDGTNDGSNPRSSVIYLDGILYGTTTSDGPGGYGTLFSFNLSSNVLTTLFSFDDGINGSNPESSVIFQNGILYGTTSSSSSGGYGTLFSFNLSSNVLTTLFSFDGGINGSNPYSSVIYLDGILYGTCSQGGTLGFGTLFSFNLSSNVLTTLYTFTGGSDEGFPYASLISQNRTLYGTTYSIFDDTSYGFGTLYSYELPPLPPIPISDICFPAGTPVTTDQGEINIENIIPLKNTINNKIIRAITKTISPDAYLICFDKDALGNNYPNKKTFISKNHKIKYKGQLIEAYKFLNDFEKVKKVEYKQEILYNVLMEKYETIKVNNLVCESLHPENIIAKLNNSNYHERYKNRIIIMMNYNVKKRIMNHIKKE